MAKKSTTADMRAVGEARQRRSGARPDHQVIRPRRGSAGGARMRLCALASATIYGDCAVV